MKRIIYLVLIVLIVLSIVAACGGEITCQRGRHLCCREGAGKTSEDCWCPAEGVPCEKGWMDYGSSQ
jgi:hypothetical protein